MSQLSALFASAVFVTSAYVTVLVFLVFLSTLLIIPFIAMPKKENPAKRARIDPDYPDSPEDAVAEYHKRLEKYGGGGLAKYRQVDTDFRIKSLTEGLADPKMAHQHENYKAALKLYKAGKSPDSTGWYFVKGRFYSDMPRDGTTPKGESLHIERLYHQLRNMETTPYKQMATSSQYRIVGNMHSIPFYMMGARDHGGGGRILFGSMINDTGSNVLTLYPSEVRAMALPQNYTGWGEIVSIMTANGIIRRRKIIIQIRILSSDAYQTPLSDWINEEAIVTLDDGAMQYDRLSGGLMRSKLFFATAPGSDKLYVANNKTAIMRELPARPNASTGQF